MPYANNKGADQPAHPRSLISAFIVHCLDSIISLLAIAKISRLNVVSVAEQAGLSLTWSQPPKTGFLVTWLDFIPFSFADNSWPTGCSFQMSRLMTKPTKWYLRPAKTQISLGIHPV